MSRPPRASKIPISVRVVVLAVVAASFIFTSAHAIITSTKAPAASSAPLSRDEWITQVLKAPVPAVCDHDPGMLQDGRLRDSKPGAVALTWISRGGISDNFVAVGSLLGAGSEVAATALACDAGGVQWPQVLVFYDYSLSQGLHLRGQVDLGRVPNVSAATQNTNLFSLRFDGDELVARWATQKNGDSAAESTLDAQATFFWDGHSIQSKDIKVSTDTTAATAYVQALQQGRSASALSMASPGVTSALLNEMRAYKALQNTMPECYWIFGAPVSQDLAHWMSYLGTGSNDRVCVLRIGVTGSPARVALGLKHVDFARWRVVWQKLDWGP